jgi:hypothetical protein
LIDFHSNEQGVRRSTFAGEAEVAGSHPARLANIFRFENCWVGSF